MLTKRDEELYQELNTMLGEDYAVMPSQAINKGIRRVVVQRRRDGETLALDLGVNRNVSPTGPVFTLGDQGGDKGPAVFSPSVVGMYNRRQDAVTFSGTTSSQDLTQRIIEGYTAKDMGTVASVQAGFSHSLSGHLDSPPVSRLSMNSPEAANREMLSRIGYEKKVLGLTIPGKAEAAPLAPHEAQKIDDAYAQGFVRGTGPIGQTSSTVKWEDLRKRAYATSKGGWLLPYAEVTYSQKDPSGQGVASSIAEILGGEKGMGKRSIEYGGTEVHPYVKTLTPGGAEILSRQQYNENYRPSSMIYPGEKSPRVTEMRNLALTPTPFSGAGLLYNTPVGNYKDVDAYARDTTLRENLPKVNVLDLLSGKTKINFPSQLGNEYSEGARGFKVGTFQREGEDPSDITMQKGVSKMTPSSQYIELPAFYDPKSGRAAASEEFGVSTANIAKLLTERDGIEYRPGSVDQVSLVLKGASQTPARIRGWGHKSGIVPTGEEMDVSFAGRNMPIEMVTGEVKGPSAAFSFLAAKSKEQLGGIMSDWASRTGTAESQQLLEYYNKRYEGNEKAVSVEALANKYRSITKNLPEGQRFLGSGIGLSRDIFNTVFQQRSEENPRGLDLSTPQDVLQNTKNWLQYEGGVVGKQDISAGPIHPEQYEMLRGFAVRSIMNREGFKGDEAAASAIFEKQFRREGGPVGETKAAMAQLPSMKFSSADTTFAGRFATPLVADDIAETRYNIEKQLAVSTQYPEFAKAMNLAITGSGGRTNLQRAVASAVGFSEFTKQAMTGKPMIPEGAETLTQEQMLRMKDVYERGDVTNEEYLKTLQNVVQDPDAMIRLPKTGAVLPSVNAQRELSYSKYGQDIGPLVGLARRSLKGGLKEELRIDSPANYDPIAAGVQAVKPLFEHVENLVQGEGEVAKHMFSKEVGAGWSGRYQLDLALPGSSVALQPDMQKMVLSRMGLRGSQINKNLSIFNQGLKGLAVRDPLIGTQSLLPVSFVGGAEHSRLRGAGNLRSVQNDPRSYGYAYTDLALSQIGTGDFDADLINTVIGMQRTGNRVTPLAPEKLQELQKLSVEELNQREAGAITNPTIRDKANAMVGAFDDYFENIGPGGEVTQANMVAKGMNKYGFMDLENVNRRAQTLYQSGTFGMGTSFNVSRQNLISAALGQKGLTAGSQGLQGLYQPFLDVYNLGQESGGSRMTTATSKFYAGMKEGDEGEPGRAFVGYSTNVKNKAGFPEYNRLYADTIGKGGTLDYMEKLATHATAPVTIGDKKEYLMGPAALAYQFAPEGEREALQKTLEGAPSEEHGYLIKKYMRDKLTPEMSAKGEAGILEYEKQLMQAPIFQGQMARAYSKAEKGTVFSETSKQSLGEFENVIGQEETSKFKTGSTIHDMIYRFPGGAVAAGRFAGVSENIQQPEIRGMMKRMMRDMSIPELPQSKVTDGPGVSAQNIEAVQEKVKTAQKDLNLGSVDAVRAAGQAAMDFAKNFSMDAVEETPVGGNVGGGGDQPPDTPSSAGTSSPDDGGGGSGNRGNRYAGYSGPPSPRQSDERVMMGYGAVLRHGGRAQQVFQELSEQFPGNDELPKRFAQMMAIDPQGTIAKLSPTATKFLRQASTAAQSRGQAIQSLPFSSYSADEQIRGTLFNPVNKMYLNQLSQIGKQIPANEAGLNPNILNLGQNLTQEEGWQDLLGGLTEAGLTDTAGMTPGQFQERAGQFFGGSPENKRLVNLARSINTGAGTGGREMLPETVRQVAALGDAVYRTDKDILKASASGPSNAIQLPVEQIEKLNRLYAQQTDVTKELISAKEKGNKNDVRELELKKANIDLDLRKETGKAYMTGLSQELEGYRTQFTAGQLEPGGIKRMRSIEKEMGTLQQEQVQQEEMEKGGQYASFARRMFGGFGLMYMRSIGNMMTSGMGFGQQERLGFEQATAASGAQIFGGGDLARNQQIQLQNQMALSGSSYSARTSMQMFGAQNPWAREIGGAAVGGVGAWGMMQYLSSMEGMGGLAKFAPAVGIATAVGNIGLQAYERAQSPDSLASRYAMGARGFSIADTVAAAGIQMTSPETYEKLQQDINFYADVNRRTASGGSTFQQMSDLYGSYGYQDNQIYSGLVQAYMQEPGGDRFSQEAHQRSLQLFSRSQGLAMTTANEQLLAGNYQLGLNYDQVAGQVMTGFGMTQYAQLSQGEDQVSAVDRLTLGLNESGLGMAEKDILTAGAGVLSRLPNIQRNTEVKDVIQSTLDEIERFNVEKNEYDTALQDLARIQEEKPGQTIFGSGGHATKAMEDYKQELAAAQARVDSLSAPSPLDISEFELLGNRAAALEGTRQLEVITAQQSAQSAAARAGMDYKAPTISSFFEEGTTNLIDMTPEQEQFQIAQASGINQTANAYMQMAQNQMNRSYQFGNFTTGDQIYQSVMAAPDSQKWAFNKAFNMDQTMLGYLGTQGMDFGNATIGTYAGGIGAAYYNQQDVGLNGQLTGLGYGRTSFAQAGGLNAQQMGAQIFGANWQSNSMFSQGAISAGIGGQELMAPITLPNGEVVSEVGGSMGMGLYQNQLAYNQQMAQLGIQNEQRQLTFAFTTGVGLSQYNNTADPRGGNFGNIGATGGFWGIQDAQRDLANTQQQWQFGFQKEGLERQSRFFMQNFELGQRQNLMQRDWTRQDWAFSDETRGMQWGWKQEDFQENARFMTGRDRRLAERQMERETIMHDREGGQIDKKRDQQEELWKLEDERFENQLAQHQESMEASEESLKKAQEFFEERKKIEEEQIRLQRAYFIQQQELQKKSTDIAAHYAEENLKVKNTMMQMQIASELTRGQLGLITDDGFERLRQVLIELNPALEETINQLSLGEYTPSSGSSGGSSGGGGGGGGSSSGGGGGAGTCFIPGTRISMANGRLKNIEDISIGDEVISYDVEAKKLITSKVEEVFTHGENEFHGYYEFNSQIKVTGEHLLLVNGEWTPARNVVVGDKFQGLDGPVIVEHIVFVSDPNVTYNFHTDHETHNYFAEGIVAHNAKTDQYAAGGDMRSGVTSIVGEEGWEFNIDGQIIPHDESVALAKRGLRPSASGQMAANMLTSMYSDMANDYASLQGSSQGSLLEMNTIERSPSQPRQSRLQPIIVMVGNEELKRFVVNTVGDEF